MLHGNDWVVLEGFNAHSAYGGRNNASVIELTSASHNIVRRVCAWDAQDANSDVFGVHHGEHNRIEDCAGWGIARKVYSPSQGGNHTTLRRCWGRWEGCHAVGPKLTFPLAYNHYDMLVENCIGTWSGQRANTHRDWQVSGLVQGATLRDTFSQAVSLFATAQGARPLRRYRDDVLTDEPLWPWPMNRRIMEAMKSAGQTPLDMTATIENLLGSIPKSQR